MINCEQMAVINGCIAGIHSSYEDKATVDEGFLRRYSQENLRFTVSNVSGERILTVSTVNNSWSAFGTSVLQINLGHVTPENQPTGPQSGEGTVAEFKTVERKVA